MHIVTVTDYAEFKTIFDGVGASRRTPVIAHVDATSGSFQAVVLLVDGFRIALAVGSKPGSFDTDFPQAVYSTMYLL